jgi:heat shock protein HtpX
MYGAMPAPRSFGRDRGLQARILLTIFLLGLVYVVLIAVLIAAGVGAIAVAVIAGALFLVQYFTSDKLALASMGAHEVSREEAPELYAIVERLCIQANLPMPRLAIADTPMPNAFAVGRSPSNATVCATTGLLRLLSPSELEAVLAHELTHVQNRDVMVMTIASFFASIAAFIVQIGFWFGGGFGGNNNNDNNGPSAIVVVLVAGVVYVVSFVLLQALSRYREFAADRGSAIITGRPSALSSALLKISGQMDQIPQRDLRAASSELAAFYIFPPKVKNSVATLFSTHPSLDQRLAALGRLESQLQGTAA